MPYDENGTWYDDSGYLSPYEQAVQEGGQSAGDALLTAANEYYTNYAQGPGDPNPGLLKPQYAGQGKEVNWTKPSSYQWLINTPGKPPAKAAEEDKAAAARASTGAGGGGSSYLDYYSWGGPMAPDLSWLKDAPAFEYADFQAPGLEGMYADPGYQFRLDQGRKALEQSAAGKGTLRTGGSLRDLISYGQQMGSQEYGNVFNRALNAYSTNLGTAKDRYAPQLASWQNDQAARQNASNRAFERAWDAYYGAVPSATTIFNAGLS
jgi:hypothetical protein